MEFRTKVQLQPSPNKIKLDTPLLSIGSCFSNTIGEKLVNNKFNILVNPLGTIFNPIAIFKLLQYALSDQRPPDFTYVKNDGVWQNLDFHSEFSTLDKADLEEKIDTALKAVKQSLAQLSYLLITPGTAWVYETKDDYLVSNCHKLPSAHFNQKRLLTIEEIVESFEYLRENLKTINPNLQYIFTVSPVRHIKDTLALNSWSKATLLLAVKSLQKKYTDIDYFPSYEIMMDDLRDYRFFKADMIHPNEVAAAYIWDLFSLRYFDENTMDFIKKWHKIKQAIAHKPFHPETSAYRSFIMETIRQLETLKGITDVSTELELLNQQLT